VRCRASTLASIATGQAHAPGTRSNPNRVRSAEIVGVVSLATDLGMGQPLEHAMRTAILAVRLGELAGASAQELGDAYYVSLLQAAGCTSDGTEAWELYGDDIEVRAAFSLVDSGDPEEVGEFLASRVGGGRPPDVREAMVTEVLGNGLALAQQTFASHCEVAQRFSNWLGCSRGTHAALAYSFERWDGRGLPGAAGGEEIALPARLLHVARDISVFMSARGRDDARATIRQRAGGAYDPGLAALAIEHFDDLLDGLDDARVWEQAMACEPEPLRWLGHDEVDAAFRAIATFSDLKSRWLHGHAEAVADLAEAAAWRLKRPAEEVALIRRAALAVDLGRVGVSNTIWEEPGPLGLTDWERVKLHTYFVERAFAHTEGLAPVGLLAGAHHERLDGSGYHRGVEAPGLSMPGRILGAADAYRAMLERRPHREALDPAGAEAALLAEAKAGRLDSEAVDAVLASAGHRVGARSRPLPAGLTGRELEVLQLLVAGQSNEQIGGNLGIATKTAGHHVQHIYGKAGVRNRAAATVWAFENSLVEAR
jgi:HD-GYP domain-containing protein (c-di-GMP phosphodiesterase class II)